MNGEQWSKLLAKNSHSKKEWVKARESAMYWCSCAIGVLVLKDDVVKDPEKLSVSQLHIKNKYAENRIPTIGHESLGYDFSKAINAQNIIQAREIWNEIHGDLK